MIDEEDDMANLRRIVALADPVPISIDVAARGAFSWRTVDAELAELAHDSALASQAELMLVRGAASGRTLSFDCDGISIEVSIESGRLIGQLSPGSPVPVVLVRDGGEERRAEADAQGRFAFDGVASGIARLWVLRRGSAPVVTPWVTV